MTDKKREPAKESQGAFWKGKATEAAAMAYPESGMHKDGDRKIRAHQRAFVDGVLWLLKQQASTQFVKPDLPDINVGDIPQQDETQPSVKPDAKIKLKVIVNGQPTDVECEQGDTFAEISERALVQTHNTARPVTDWNLMRHDGKELWPVSYVGSYQFKEGEAIFLSLKAGIGASLKPGEMRSLTKQENEILQGTLRRTASRMPEREENISPVTVRITKCSYEQGWYANAIGREFKVDNAGGNYDYIVWEDYIRGHNVWRHIKKEDCEIISRNSPQPSSAVKREIPEENREAYLAAPAEIQNLAFEFSRFYSSTEETVASRNGAIRMYNKMQEDMRPEIAGYVHTVAEQSGEIASLQRQLSAAQAEAQEYRKAMEFALGIKDLWGPDSFPYSEGKSENEGEAEALGSMQQRFSELIIKYPSPQNHTKQ